MSVSNPYVAETLLERSRVVEGDDVHQSLRRSEMTLGCDWRIRLLERASTLRERLGNDFAPMPDAGIDSQSVARRLARWRLLAAKGSEVAFAKLLSMRGLDPDQLEPRLGRVRWVARKPLPQWLTTLARVVDETQGLHPADIPADPVSPWTAFMRPFVAVFGADLKQSCEHMGIAATNTVSDSAERALARGLGMLFNAPLAAEYAALHARFGLSSDDAATRVEFLQQLMKPTRLVDFLVEYSVAARGAAQLIEQSQQNLAEMLARLQHDRDEIRRRFLPQCDPGELVALDSALSDPHRGGRSVMRLHLASGLRLIYKPRSVSMDLAYGDLLNWLRAQGLAHSLRTPKYLARDEYAWVEHIDHAVCATPAELDGFCRNAGVLLAVAYLLDATDLHDGNLIAAGSSPVIIDLETLLQPRLREPAAACPQDALREVVRLIDHSVMRSGLLPFLRAGPDGSLADVGCLGGLFDYHSAPWYEPDANSSPLTPGAAWGSDPHLLAGEIARGFADTYRFMMTHRAALAAPCGPLLGFARQRPRFLFRDTNLYIRLLEPSLSATALREGVDRSIELEALYRTVLMRDASAMLVAAVDAEVEALEALDIPLLGAVADDDALVTQSGKRCASFFQKPGFTALLERIDALSEQDLKFQLSLVELAFGARAAGAGESETPGRARGFGLAPSHPADPARLAAQLLDELGERKISGEDGSVTWLAPVQIENGERWNVGPMPLDRRAGNLGVALFAAASARQPGGARAAGLARSATALVLRRLQLQPGSIGRYIAGNGDSLYALAHIAGLLGDEALRAQTLDMLAPQSWLDEALQAVAAREHDACELFFGLRALGRDDEALRVATQLLIRWQRASASGRATLLRNAPRLPVCFARAGQHAEDDGLRSAGVEALCMLNEVSRHDPGTLSTLRSALVACVGVAQETGLREHLPGLLAAFDDASPCSFDPLEGGECGRIELLLSAGIALADPELRKRAETLAKGMIKRAAGRGGFSLVPGMPAGTMVPGFDQGVAGIGYTLLRLQRGAALPSVLLRE